MTFIVAEIGSNWATLEDAKESISLAKSCGADAAKFQLYDEKSLYGFATGKPVPGTLPLEWLPKLFSHASGLGIELMCTPFSPDAVNQIDPFVSRHKISSCELPYVELLERVKSRSKPILLSTGGATFREIQQALDVLEDADVTLLHCVAAYPAKNPHFYRIELLREAFPNLRYKIGYSCHSVSMDEAIIAAHCYGASVIEKHFKKSKEMDTPDSGHSIGPEEFREMVKRIRNSKRISAADLDELEVIRKHRRRLIAIKNIKEGEIMQYGKNYGCYRPYFESGIIGMTGFMDEHFDGVPAHRSFKKGDGIV